MVVYIIYIYIIYYIYIYIYIYILYYIYWWWWAAWTKKCQGRLLSQSSPAYRTILSLCVFVMNLVYELPLTHHQRSLAHHMDSCTTLLSHSTLDCISHHPLHWQHTAVTNLTLLWLHSWSHNHTRFISLGLPLCDRRVLFSVYPSDSYSTEPTQLLVFPC